MILLPAGVLLWPHRSAAADDLKDLLLDAQGAQRFLDRLASSVLPISVRVEHPNGIDPIGLPSHYGAAVVVRNPAGGLWLLTSGPLLTAGPEVVISLPGGRTLSARGGFLVGEGVLGVIPVTDPAVAALLQPVTLASDAAVKKTVPVFAIGNLGGPRRSLAKGTVLEVLTAPLDGLFFADFVFYHGAPFFTASGRLAGIAFRAHPAKKALSVAVSGARIHAWLHPEGPPERP